MFGEPSDAAKAEQREVQRLLGRCILQLQLYERLLKALLAERELLGPVQDLAAIRAKRENRVGRHTLGTLVREFVGAYLVSATPPDEPDPINGAEDCAAACSFRIVVEVSPDEHDRITRGLKELVDLRNGLVHHFVDRHDLWSVDGCQRAKADLVAAFDRIEAHYLELVEIAKTHDAARQYAAEVMQSEAF